MIVARKKFRNGWKRAGVRICQQRRVEGFRCDSNRDEGFREGTNAGL